MDNRVFMTAEDVAKELGTSKAFAYKLIKELNKEMEEKGYITLAGKVNRNFFYEKMYCGERKDHAGLQGQ